MTKETELLIAVGTDDYYKTEELINNPEVDPTYLNNTAFVYACKGDDIAIISILLHHPKVNTADQDNQAFVEAANRCDKYGFDIINFLMKNISIRENITRNTYDKINNPKIAEYIREKLLRSKLKEF
jgi:hypothetical protein